MVRAKFFVESVNDDTNPDQKLIKFRAVADKDGIPEEAQFTKYTPVGELWLVVNGPAVDQLAVVGKKFYLDLVEAPAS